MGSLTCKCHSLHLYTFVAQWVNLYRKTVHVEELLSSQFIWFISIFYFKLLLVWFCDCTLKIIEKPQNQKSSKKKDQTVPNRTKKVKWKLKQPNNQTNPTITDWRIQGASTNFICWFDFIWKEPGYTIQVIALWYKQFQLLASLTLKVESWSVQKMLSTFLFLCWVNSDCPSPLYISLANPNFAQNNKNFNTM